MANVVGEAVVHVDVVCWVGFVVHVEGSELWKVDAVDGEEEHEEEVEGEVEVEGEAGDESPFEVEQEKGGLVAQ